MQARQRNNTRTELRAPYCLVGAQREWRKAREAAAYLMPWRIAIQKRQTAGPSGRPDGTGGNDRKPSLVTNHSQRGYTLTVQHA